MDNKDLTLGTAGFVLEEKLLGLGAFCKIRHHIKYYLTRILYFHGPNFILMVIRNSLNEDLTQHYTDPGTPSLLMSTQLLIGRIE